MISKIFNFFITQLQNQYTTWKVITKNGIWIKDNLDDGSIIINSEKINKYPIYQRTLKFKIGFVPQNINLLDDSIKKNIAFGLNEQEISEANIKRSVSYGSNL